MALIAIVIFKALFCRVPVLANRLTHHVTYQPPQPHVLHLADVVDNVSFFLPTYKDIPTNPFGILARSAIAVLAADAMNR